MDAAEEQRLLHILRAAQGDPALLSLVPLDLTFAEAPQPERERLRTALIAAAVPHWFDGPFLAALLATSADEACDLMGKLRRLTNVETFPARGESACNVHEASRLALRQHLRTQQPDLWQSYARRAHEHLAAGKETHERIEALYHLFAADTEAAVPACEALDRDLRHNPTTRSALCLALTELKTEGWLTGAALVEALRAPLWYRVSRDEVSQLEAEARTLLALAQRHAHPFRVADAHDLMGDVHLTHGELAKAKECQSECHGILRELTASDPTHAQWQRDLSISLIKLGDLAVAQGDLAGALRSFTESKSIRERLAASDPANAEWQRDLAVSLIKLGDLAVKQGDLAGAWRSFTEAKTIAERLAASDPANAQWQRDLSVSLNKLGDLAMAQGDLAGAWRSFTEAKTIAERLAKSDPANAEWQRDLSVSLIKHGDLAVAQEDPAGALRSFTEAKTIAERLAKSDPANAQWQRDLSVSLNKLGDLAKAQGDLAGALRSFTQSKTIAERLAKSDPANAEWQRDLAVSFEKLGDVAVKQEDWVNGERYYRDGLRIAERLTQSDPMNAGWQRHLAVSHFKLYEFAKAKGDEAMAATELHACYTVLHGMKQRGLHFDPQMAAVYKQLHAAFGEASSGT